MATVNKTNPVPQVTEAKITLPDMLRTVIVQAKATRTAALDLCYSAAAYILLASHFRDAKAKDYMTRSDCRDYLAKEIKNQANVQGGMLDLYIRNADKLASILIGSAKMFSPVLQRIGMAEKPEQAVSELAKWADANLLKITGSGDRQTSMRGLSEALGFSTGRKAPTPGLTAEPEAVQSRVKSAVAAVEKLVIEGDKTGKKLHARVITNAIANAIPPEQSLSLAREAVKRMTDPDDLKALEAAIADQRKVLANLKSDATSAAKAKAKEGSANGTAKRNPRAAVQHTQA